MDIDGLRRLLATQSGLVRRAQVLALGGTDNDIERLLRRREWARVHPGVFVDHTGPLSWTQRAWAAVLVHWPAALSGASALRAHGIPAADEADPIDLVVPARRHPIDPPGIRTSRVVDFEEVALLNLSPPRVRVEHAAGTVASESRADDAAVAVLADVCQRRRSTPQRLADSIRGRPSLKRRALLLEILDDVASGAYSVMERRYLTGVERPHGLPTASRQRRIKPGRTAAYRDVDYLGTRTVIELDGRLGHEWTTDRWDDLDRDIDAAVAGDLTVRIGWRQVLDPCRLAGAVGRLLVSRGWRGAVTACGPTCPVTGTGDRPAPDAGEPPEAA